MPEVSSVNAFAHELTSSTQPVSAPAGLPAHDRPSADAYGKSRCCCCVLLTPSAGLLGVGVDPMRFMTPAAPGDEDTTAAGAAAKAQADHDSDEDADHADRIDADEPMYQPGMNWFVLRVASNKENYVRDTLRRKVQIEGLEHLVGRILVPTEKTKTMKGGRQRIQETKLYPGYVFVEMRLEEDGRIPQDVFFLIKETTGVGDFVGTTGKPAPLSVHEVEKMLHDSKKPEESPQIKADFAKGDVVKIKEGPFENYEGTVDEFLPDKGIVRVLVTIFGRQAPIEVEYWMLARADEQ